MLFVPFVSIQAKKKDWLVDVFLRFIVMKHSRVSGTRKNSTLRIHEQETEMLIIRNNICRKIRLTGSRRGEVSASDKGSLLQGVIRGQWHFNVFGAVILTRTPSGQRHEGVDSYPTPVPVSPRVRHEFHHFESIRTTIECKCVVLWLAFTLTSCRIRSDFMKGEEVHMLPRYIRNFQHFRKRPSAPKENGEFRKPWNINIG